LENLLHLVPRCWFDRTDWPLRCGYLQFNYSFPRVGISISAAGTLAVGDLDPGSGGFPILSITGTRTVNGADTNITGLTSYFGTDDLLFYPDLPFID
jgi:hypothetical protein